MDILLINDSDGVIEAKVQLSPQLAAILTSKVVTDKRGTFDQEVMCMSKRGKCVVDISDKTPAAYLKVANLPQKKRVKLIVTKPVIMDKELSDVQFPVFSGLQSTLLQKKKMLLTEKSVRNKVQIVHCKGRHHSVVASTICCHLGEVKVYNSLFTYCDKETEKVIFNLF